MINAKVQKEIDSSRRFGEQLENIVVSKHQFPTGDANVLLIAYWALMFDYHKGTLSLLRLHRSDARLVRAIEEALTRIRQGTFGVCKACGQRISKARLEAVPWTHLCRACKERQNV